MFSQFSDRAQKAMDLLDTFTEGEWREADSFDAFSGRGAVAYLFNFLDN